MIYYLLPYTVGAAMSCPMTADNKIISFPPKTMSHANDHLKDCIHPTDAAWARVEIDWRPGIETNLQDVCVKPDAILLSDRARHLFESVSLPSDTCIVSTEVSSRNRAITDYSLLFSQEFFDVIDRSQSIFDCLPKTDIPRHVFSWCLDPSNIPPFDLFRPNYAGKWIATERLIQGVQQLSLEGFDFIPIWSTVDGPLQCIPSPYFKPPKSFTRSKERRN